MKKSSKSGGEKGYAKSPYLPKKGQETGVIFNIQRYSLHDGPGGRTTVFLKGCQLRCAWCANPESWEFAPLLMRIDRKCIKCGACLSVCPEGAITIDMINGRQVDYVRCTQCLKCVEICPTQSLVTCGETMSVDQVVSTVLRDRNFYEHSGGGVTLSGGEPACQVDFAEAILRACKENRIHTALETNGNVPYAQLERLVKWTDLLLYDIKHMDSEAHRKFTGAGNEQILANVAEVAQKVETWLRVPVISGFNASDDFFSWLGKFGQRIGAKKISLLPYHEWGMSKFEQINSNYVNTHTFKTPSSGDLERYGSLCEASGIKVDYGR
ncbi:MAG: glycyl-radical enzyme activating protein [Smithellaceae bacterium]